MSFGNNIPVDLRKWLSSLLSNYGGSQKDVLQKKIMGRGKRNTDVYTPSSSGLFIKRVSAGAVGKENHIGGDGSSPSLV